MNMTKWEGVEFESSSGLTKQFSEFAKDFKKYINQQLYAQQEIVGWNRGHFYVSGFIRHRDEQGDRFVYFSTSDVRGFPGEWSNNVLIRTARNEKDYIGRRNHYCRLELFAYNVLNLTMRLGGTT